MSITEFTQVENSDSTPLNQYCSFLQLVKLQLVIMKSLNTEKLVQSCALHLFKIRAYDQASLVADKMGKGRIWLYCLKHTSYSNDNRQVCNY